MMKRVNRNLASAAVIVVAVIAASVARADDEANRYVMTPLVSDLAGASFFLGYQAIDIAS